MEKLHRLSPDKRRDIIFGSIAALVIIADQVTKRLILHYIPENSVWWDGGIFQIIHITNTGVSFGLFKGYIEVIIAVVCIEILIILFIVYLFRNKLSFLDSTLMRVGAGLILGGAIGNQIDRIAQGYVTDFIDFKWWPAWNVADGSAVVGTFIVVYCIIFRSGLMKQKHE